jgi:signal transduction histidine kinase
MKYWFKGKFLGLLVYALIAALVAGGLGWVTWDALRMEQERWAERADAQYNDQLHLALWRLDGRISPVLAREDSRPYNHFSAIYAPSAALRSNGMMCATGTVLEISPLVGADLPDWVALHFQTDATGWSSPQVLSPAMAKKLSILSDEQREAATPDRCVALDDLSKQLKPDALLTLLRNHDEASRQDETTVFLSNPSNFAGNQLVPQQLGPPPPVQEAPNGAPLQGQGVNQYASKVQQDVQQQKVDPEFLNRAGQQTRVKQEMNRRTYNNNDISEVAIANTSKNGERWLAPDNKLAPRGKQVTVQLGSMAPVWMKTDDGQDRLIVARLVRIGEKELCQGLLIDWPRLQQHLAGEVADLFPEARFIPVREELPEDRTRRMASLPIELDAGLRPSLELPNWTPMRIGLSLAWAAALVALLAVGLGGWTLLQLSERRIRFVSAVTHELRTPLTTLRLYLDMLTGGIVQDEQQKQEYLHTLHTETERLNRLVGNVLDFSRLENQRPRLEMTRIAVADLIEQVRDSWHARCESCDKLLIVEDRTPAGAAIATDIRLVPQILGNLIDNACKYSQGADDRRIWLRSSVEGNKLVLEVEDRGAGVAKGERRTIFRAFRRGRANETTGGVGLGLALARRWATLLGGRLILRPAPGACFRLELPHK